MTKHTWEDSNPAVSYMHGFKILENLGLSKDQMIESATIDLMSKDLVKLNVVYILSVKQLKQMGVDLNAES